MSLDYVCAVGSLLAVGPEPAPCSLRGHCPMRLRPWSFSDRDIPKRDISCLDRLLASLLSKPQSASFRHDQRSCPDFSHSPSLLTLLIRDLLTTSTSWPTLVLQAEKCWFKMGRQHDCTLTTFTANSEFQKITSRNTWHNTISWAIKCLAAFMLLLRRVLRMPGKSSMHCGPPCQVFAH